MLGQTVKEDEFICILRTAITKRVHNHLFAILSATILRDNTTSILTIAYKCKDKAVGCFCVSSINFSRVGNIILGNTDKNVYIISSNHVQFPSHWILFLSDKVLS